MAFTARSQRNRFAWGIQSAEGTAMATNGSLYEVNLFSGGITPQSDEVPYETSDAFDMAENTYIRKVWWTGDAEIPVDVDSIGSLFTAHLGTCANSGTTTVTHTITRGTPQFATFYEMKPGVSGGTDYWLKNVDGIVKSIELSATPGEIVHAKLDLIGKSPIWNPTTTPSPSRDMRISTGAQSLATFIGATIKLDTAATPATTTVHNVESLTITSAYPNLDLIQTDATVPGYVSQGGYSLGIAATVILSTAEWATLTNTFYSTATYTTNDVSPSTNPASPTTGAADFTFAVQGATASRSVQLVMPSIRWMGAYPTVDVSGAAVRVSLTGTAIYNAAPITVTTVNGRAAY